MIAYLGMYDPPALRGANNRFWHAIRRNLGYGPDKLTRDKDPWEIWLSPDLLFAQTCGMPFRTRLHRTVQLVGTPDYGLPDCGPGYYCSVLIARRDGPIGELSDCAGSVFAFNEPLSQSGWAAPISHLHQARVSPGELLRTGAHAASAGAVAEGRADLAGLDALTWTLLQEHEPGLTGRLRVIEHTCPTPGLPFVTGASNDPGLVADAVRRAIDELAPEDRGALHIHGLEAIPAAAYRSIPTPPGPDAVTPDLAPTG